MYHDQSDNIMMAMLRLTVVFLTSLFMNTAAAEAESGSRTSKESGLTSWFWRNSVFSFNTEQRLPDQTRAFFLARGLPETVVEAIAGSCVFQVEVRNLSPAGGPSVNVTLESWRVIHNGISTPPRLAEDWQQEFRNRSVPQEAAIALRWSLFPGEQAFEPGDYNWGMVSYGPKPNARFDLALVWREGSEKHQTTIAGLVCAEDR
jgi:hypothetical protein